LMNWIGQHPDMLTNLLLPAIVAIIAAVWAKVRESEKLQGNTIAKAMDCLAAGVQKSYDEYVRVIKLKSEDGKLSDEERKEARQIAIDAAIVYAKTYGIDLLKTLGEETVPFLIEKILITVKAKAGVTGVPSPVSILPVESTTCP